MEFNTKQFNVKAAAAAVLLAVAGGAQAEILNGFGATDGELFISIYRDNASPESMIVDTDVSLFALRTGGVGGWTSSTAQSTAIQTFLATAPLSDFRFNAGGVTQTDDIFDIAKNPNDGFFTTSNDTVTPTLLPLDSAGFATVRSNIGTFLTQINNAYTDTSAITGLTDGEPGFHQQTGLWANDIGSTVTTINTEGAVDGDLTLWNGYNASADLLGYELAFDALGTLNINAATGVASLTTSPVPVPAAAWLFGSGLVGMIGVARRRKAA